MDDTEIYTDSIYSKLITSMEEYTDMRWGIRSEGREGKGREMGRSEVSFITGIFKHSLFLINAM